MAGRRLRTWDGVNVCEITYKNLHESRRALIDGALSFLKYRQATVEKIEEVEVQAVTGRCIRLGLGELQRWLTPPVDNGRKRRRGCYTVVSGINYEAVTGDVRDWMHPLGLTGLFWFVNHSDNAGSWSPGQAMDMMATMTHLREHVKMTPLLKDFMGVCADAVNERQHIYFE